MKAWKIIVSVVLAAAIAGAIFAFYPRSGKNAAATPAGQVVEIKRGTVQLTISASGSISLPRQAKLTFGSSGIVAEVKVRTGDRVKQGQVLAKLDPGNLERSLARTEADLRLALERQKLQYTSADIISAQASIDSAKANLAKVEADLSVATLEQASAQASVDSAKANLAKAEADLNASILERASAQATVGSAKANLAKAEADLSASILERASAQAAVDQAKQNLDALQKRAPLDIWDAENTEHKAADYYLNVAKQVRTSTDPTNMSASLLAAAWQEWQKAQLQLSVQKQAIADAITDAQNTLATAQDNLARVLPSGATIQQREATVASAKATLARAEDDLSRLLPGGTTIQQREAAISAAKSTLNKAQEQLANMKAGGSSVDLLSQEITISKLQTEIVDIKENLAKATIQAPFDGVINDVSVKEGDNVSGSAVAIVLIDTSQMEVQATVDEVDVGQLRLGQEANVTLDALPDLALKGRVVSVAPDAKVQSGVVSYAVSVALLSPEASTTQPQARTQQQTPRSGAATPGATQPQARTQQQTPGSGGTTPGARSPRAQRATGGYEAVKGGMTALAEIILQQKQDVLVVSNRAIKTSGQDKTVQVVLPSGLTETRKVTTGLSDGQNTEITAGLSEGEKVLIPAQASRAATGGTSQQSQTPRIPGMPRL